MEQYRSPDPSHPDPKTGAPAGLFLGMATLDLIYRVERPPGVDEKRFAQDQLLLPGGPAANAAVAFAALGGNSTLAVSVGSHPLGRLVQSELARDGVRLLDLAPERTEPPPLSSIMIRTATGERAVIATRAPQVRLAPARAAELLLAQEIVLVDGNQMAAGQAICARARAGGIPCVLDGGSWKAGTDDLLPSIDYAICSADFMPPGCRSHAEVIAYLAAAGVPRIAITRGPEPVLVFAYGAQERLPVPRVEHVVDTLGAGDIFHGAFCNFILTHRGDFWTALHKAARVAALSCQTFGTRQWISDERLPGILAA